MPKLTMYYYPKCGTCRNAIKWLQTKGYELELHDLFLAAPNASQLAELVQHSGLEMKKFWNTSGDVYKSEQLKDKVPQMSDTQQLMMLASNGRLIKRPIVTDGKQVTVGFKEDMYEAVWGEA